MSLTAHEKSLFSKILGIEGYTVDDIQLDEGKKQLDIFLAPPEPPIICPVCGKEHQGFHDKRERVVRDKDWADNKVYLHFFIVRIRCCKASTPIEVEPVEFVKKNIARLNGSAR